MARKGKNRARLYFYSSFSGYYVDPRDDEIVIILDELRFIEIKKCR